MLFRPSVTSYHAVYGKINEEFIPDLKREELNLSELKICSLFKGTKAYMCLSPRSPLVDVRVHTGNPSATTLII